MVWCLDLLDNGKLSSRVTFKKIVSVVFNTEMEGTREGEMDIQYICGIYLQYYCDGNYRSGIYLPTIKNSLTIITRYHNLRSIPAKELQKKRDVGISLGCGVQAKVASSLFTFLPSVQVEVSTLDRKIIYFLRRIKMRSSIMLDVDVLRDR
jgi:hypothetical protein